MDKFNLKLVNECFTSSLYEGDDVLLNFYLQSFNELNKFFNLMGTIFGFVSQDLEDKINILHTFLNKNEDGGNFKSIKTMMLYEKDENLLYKDGYVSGSRTLLRIHRGLDFIRHFLRSLGEINDDHGTHYSCKQAYDRTLAKYHPFLIRTGAKIAMYTLPTRGALLSKVCGDEESIKETISILPQTLEVIAEVFDRIENLYSLNKLHNLP